MPSASPRLPGNAPGTSIGLVVPPRSFSAVTSGERAALALQLTQGFRRQADGSFRRALNAVADDELRVQVESHIRVGYPPRNLLLLEAKLMQVARRILVLCCPPVIRKQRLGTLRDSDLLQARLM